MTVAGLSERLSEGLAQMSSLSSMADKIDLSPSLSKFASDIGDAGDT